MQPESRLRPLLLLGAIVLLGAVLIWIWSGWTPSAKGGRALLPQGLEATLLSTPRPLPPFQLTDVRGAPLDNSHLAGQWTFVFFGYTHCPDICPTTLLTLKQVHDRLAGQADPHFLFVSLDPQRDTPEILGDYVRHFDPAFLGASGERAVLDALTTALAVPYTFSGDVASGDYVVNHTATLLLIDPQARLIARFATTQPAEAIAAAFLRIRDFYAR